VAVSAVGMRFCIAGRGYPPPLESSHDTPPAVGYEETAVILLWIHTKWPNGLAADAIPTQTLRASYEPFFGSGVNSNANEPSRVVVSRS